jgi:hypothetical protein
MSKKVASRFGSTPVVRDGFIRKKPPAALTELDWKILEALVRYRLLSADYIAALVGSSQKYMTTVLQVLKSEPQRYIKLCDEQADPNNQRYYLHTTLYYELDSAGITQLRERGFSIPPRKRVTNFVHQIMEDQIMASFEIGAKDGVQQIDRNAVLANPQTPNHTRLLAEPECIPLPDVNGKPRFYRPDGTFFVIKNEGKFAFVPGIEADCGTEPINATDYARSSIRRKFFDIVTILENDLHVRHFGARTFFVPFYFPTERRMENAKHYWKEETESCPAFRKNVLFRTHPLFTSKEKPQATGHAITEPYQRVGYPPFSFV